MKNNCSAEQEMQRRFSSLLTDRDRASGFSVQSSDGRSIALLKGGKSVAWFSAAVSAEMVRAMARLIASREEAAKQ